jgi:hypothetical protein
VRRTTLLLTDDPGSDAIPLQQQPDLSRPADSNRKGMPAWRDLQQHRHDNFLLRYVPGNRNDRRRARVVTGHLSLDSADRNVFAASDRRWRWRQGSRSRRPLRYRSVGTPIDDARETIGESPRPLRRESHRFPPISSRIERSEGSEVAAPSKPHPGSWNALMANPRGPRNDDEAQSHPSLATLRVEDLLVCVSLSGLADLEFRRT